MSRISRVCPSCADWLPKGETRCETHKSIPPTWGVVAEAPRVDGKRRRKVRKGFTTRREAETALAVLLTELDQGTHVEPSELTLSMWMDRWLTTSKMRVKPSTWASYEAANRKHIAPSVGNVKLQRLDQTTVEIFYTRLTDTLAPKSIRNVHAILRRALGEAVGKGLLRHNPADGAFQMRVPKPQMAVWDASQLYTFLASIEDHRFGALFKVAAATGMRRGELMALRWQDIEPGAIVVRRSLTRAGKPWGETEPKNGKVRRVEIDEGTKAVLEAQRRTVAAHRLAASSWVDNDLVFPHETSGLHVDGDVITQTFGKAVKESGLPSQRLHDLRHSHASILIKAGVPVNVVSKRLGHATVGFTLDVYSWCGTARARRRPTCSLMRSVGECRERL